MKTVDEPHAKRRGWLKNGNPPGNPSLAPRCGAKTRSKGCCAAPAMKNGRCRMHGGSSTGPKTRMGLMRSTTAKVIHGRYSREAVMMRRITQLLLRQCHETEEIINAEK